MHFIQNKRNGLAFKVKDRMVARKIVTPGEEFFFELKTLVVIESSLSGKRLDKSWTSLDRVSNFPMKLQLTSHSPQQFVYGIQWQDPQLMTLFSISQITNLTNFSKVILRFVFVFLLKRNLLRVASMTSSRLQTKQFQYFK